MEWTASIEECDWIHEAVRLLAPTLHDEIKVDELLLALLRASYVLDDKDINILRGNKTGEILLKVLIEKEDPSVWANVLENLPKTKKIHEYVVKVIKNEADNIRKSPAKVLEQIEDRNICKPLQNSAKLANLLLDVGLSTLVKLFCAKMTEEYGSMDKAYQSEIIQDSIENHMYGVKGKVKSISDKQHDIVKSSHFEEHQIKEFNFSLTVALLEITVLNADQFTSSTTNEKIQLQEILNKIKSIRNHIFVDISNRGTANIPFYVMWGDLVELFTKLEKNCSNLDIQDDIDACMSKKFCKSEIDELRTQMMLCVENDMLDANDLIAKNQMILNYQQRQFSKVVPCLIQSVENLGDVVQLHKQLPPEFRREISFDDKTKLYSKLEEMARRQHDTLKLLESGQELFTTTRAEIQEIRNLISASKDSKCLDDVYDIFEKNKSSFKILVLNKPGIAVSEAKKLAYVLGCCPWNIIIDMDHTSRSENGMHDHMQQIFAKYRDFKVITYKQMKSVQGSSALLQAIGRSEKSLWILANGCIQDQCEPSDRKFGKVATKLPSLIENILEEVVSPRPMIAVLLRLSCACQDPMEEIVSVLFNVCECLEDSNLLALDDSHIVSLLVKPATALSIRKKTISYMQIETSSAQIIATFARLFSQDDVDVKHFFPGEKGLCSIAKEDLIRLQTLMTLYFKDIGRISLEGKTAEESSLYMDAYRIKFLRGGEISPEGFFLQDEFNGHIYAKRSEMSRAEGLIEKELKKRANLDIAEQHAFPHLTIGHDPSGGGTTVMMYALYRLKDQFPCFLLNKEFDETAISIFVEKYRDSGRPLLIAVDSDISGSAVAFLQQRLLDQYVRCLVVHVKQVHRDSAEADKCSLFVTSSLESGSDDHIKFCRLYEQIKNSRTIDVTEVFLFGLLAFTEDYERLSTLVAQCLKTSTTVQQTIIRVICGVRLFCRFDISVQLFWPFICESATRVNLKEDFITLLGHVANLVIYDHESYTVRPAHQCIVEPVFTELENTKTRGEALKDFLKDLYYIISSEQPDKKKSAALLQVLLFQRQNPIEEHYSKFITTLEKETSSQYVEETLVMFITLLEDTADKNHIRALYARYLLYQMNKLDESVHQIKLAVNIGTHSIVNTDPIHNEYLLTTYGYLYRKIMNIQFGVNLGKLGLKTAIHVALEHSQEAVRAFELAQNIRSSSALDGFMMDKFSSTPLVGEAIVRSELLQLLFKYECKSDHRLFNEYLLETDNNYIQGCEFAAFRALDKLDEYGNRGLLYDTKPSETNNRMSRCKFRLLRLRSDASAKTSLILRSMPSHVTCDVGYFVIHSEGIDSSPAKMSDLSIEKLRLIYEVVRVRDEKRLLSSNYRDIILAMIYLKHTRVRDEFNIEYTMEWAKKWTQHFPSERDSFFLYGVLLLAYGYWQNNVDLISDGKRYIDQSAKMKENNLSVKFHRKLRFYLGCGDGLEKLLPYKPEIERSRLQRFSGRLISDHKVIVEPVQCQFIARLDKLERLLAVDQQPKVTFNLVVGNDSVAAINVAKQELDWGELYCFTGSSKE